MAKVSDEMIREFATAQGCTEVVVTRPMEASGKRSIYLQYICRCGFQTGTKWKRFNKNPRCKNCAMATLRTTTDEVIIAKLQSMQMEFVRAERITGKRVKVYFVCHCDKNTTRQVECKSWDGINNTTGCNKCSETRRKQTCMDKYGVASPPNNSELRKQIRENNLTKYGVDHISKRNDIKLKVQATVRERYGIENPFDNPIIIKKTKQTMMEKFGVEHSMHNSEIRAKQQRSSFHNKTYIFPSGREVQCQGYEPWALDELLKRGYCENDIITDNEFNSYEQIPQFWYVIDEKRHRYYPDICILSERKIIEVKSEYTANTDPIILEKKMDCVLENGFEIELWIFNNKKELTIW